MLTLRTKLFYLEKTKRQKDCNDMEKILIVEDDIAFGTMIQTWLRKKGFEVEKTTSVKAAIQAWEKLESGLIWCYPTFVFQTMMVFSYCNG